MSRHRLITGCLLAAIFSWFCWLRREAGYGDGPGSLLVLRRDAIWESGNHLLFLPLLWAWLKVLGSDRLTDFRLAGAFCALTVTVGLGFFNAALRRMGVTPRRAALATILTAFYPATLFFATAVELHALMFMTCGMSFYVAGRVTTQGGAFWHMAFVFCLVLCYGAHATAHLWAVTLVAFFALTADETASARSRWLQGLAHLGAYGAVTLLALPLLRHTLGSQATSDGPARFLITTAQKALENPASLPPTVINEYFVAYLPASFVVLFLCWRRESRRPACIVSVAAAVYALISWLLLSGAREHGAYLLPLAMLFSVAILTWARTWVLAALTVVTMIWGSVYVKIYDNPEASTMYADACRRFAAERPITLIVGDGLDISVAVVELPDVDIVLAPTLMTIPCADLLPELSKHVDALLSSGHAVYLTKGAVLLLRNPAALSLPCASEIVDHILEDYTTRWIADGPFEAYEIVAARHR